MRSFETYKMYVGIKRHFEQPTYDYFLYNGVSKGLSLDKFLSRRGLPHYFQIFKLINSSFCLKATRRYQF